MCWIGLYFLRVYVKTFLPAKTWQGMYWTAPPGPVRFCILWSGDHHYTGHTMP